MNDKEIGVVSTDVVENAKPESTTVQNAEQPVSSEKSIPVHTQKELDSMSPNEKLDVLKSYADVIDLATKQSTTNREINNVLKYRDEVQQYMKTTEDIDPMELINAKLNTVANAEVLANEYLPYPEKVKWFFINDETGKVVDFDFPEDGKIAKDLLEFQKDLLLFLKRCDDSIAEYNRISEEADKELKAIKADIDEINRLMGSNVLAFVEALKQSVTPESENYKEVMDICTGIMSAYDFSLVFDTVKEYPSVIKNTLDDFKKESRIKDLANRYAIAVDRSRTSVNLITFLPRSKDVLTIEKAALSKFYRPGTDDLFIFIMIRWFAMNKLDDAKSKKFHAALYHVLYQLLNGQLVDAVSDMVVENMKKLLTLFYDQMPLVEGTPIQDK